MACSRLRMRGGTSRMASSAVEARIFVSFFSLTMLPLISASQAFFAYYHALHRPRVPGEIKISPRSCRLKIAYPVALPSRDRLPANPVGAHGDVALPFDIALEQRVHDGRSARIGENFAAQPRSARAKAHGTPGARGRSRGSPSSPILPLRAPSFSIPPRPGKSRGNPLPAVPPAPEPCHRRSSMRISGLPTISSYPLAAHHFDEDGQLQFAAAPSP